MKRIFFTCAMIFVLAACGGGKHEPIVRDSAAANLNGPAPGSGVVDKTDSPHIGTNGEKVNPIDTANINKPKP